MNTRVEPNNQDAEKSVLASMLMSKYALQKCADSLTKDEFIMITMLKYLKQ